MSLWVSRLGIFSKRRFLMYLKLISNGITGVQFQLTEGQNIVGRADPSENILPEINLEQFDVDAKVSRRHALISKTSDKVVIEDLGSLNGTFINRSLRLEKGMLHELEDGDEVLIGKVMLRFFSGD